jgi:D-alanine-D-alanine ligase
MKIGICYDLQEDAQDEAQAEFDPPRVIEAILASMSHLADEAVLIGNVFELLRKLRDGIRYDLVLNICEGHGSRNRESTAPILLELYGIPFVGSDALSLSLGLDKHLTKYIARSINIPTPRWVSIDAPHLLAERIDLKFPLIVKPRHEGSGIGIDEDSVVNSFQELLSRVKWLFGRLGKPIIIEEFIKSGELTVCIIGNSPAVAYPAIQRSIDSRSRLSSHVIKNASPSLETPLQISPDMDAEAARISLRMFNELGCFDMARVDLRVDEAGNMLFLEINPLPSLDPEGSFGLLAEYIGSSYTQMLGKIIDSAKTRYGLSGLTNMR